MLKIIKKNKNKQKKLKKRWGLYIQLSLSQGIMGFFPPDSSFFLVFLANEQKDILSLERELKKLGEESQPNH